MLKQIKNNKIYKILKYLKHYNKYANNNDNRFNLEYNNRQIELNDWGYGHQFDRHYFYHTAWASRKLYEFQPEKHVDIGSDIRFSSFISTFVKTEYYDIRELNIQLSGLVTKVADLTCLPFDSDSINSLSCMHVIEHCGLGRYGDVVNPKADLIAMNELIRVLAPSGLLCFVVPIAGTPKIKFNAHRIYSYEQIMDYFGILSLQEFVLIPDHYKDGNLVNKPSKDLLNKQKYGCGCFLFTKK